MAKSLDKARGEQKAVRRGGAIGGVLVFSLSEDSWASVSGSVSMPTAFGKRMQRAVFADGRPLPSWMYT